jgi:hypothetical protein
MNPGLPQGFVRFDSVPCAILKFIYEHGEARHVDLFEEGVASEFAIAMALVRLRRCGFIIRLGRASAYDTGDRTQAVYAIIGAKRRRDLESTKNATDSERTKRWRQNRRKRVPSVFQFRGEIHVTSI